MCILPRTQSSAYSRRGSLRGVKKPSAYSRRGSFAWGKEAQKCCFSALGKDLPNDYSITRLMRVVVSWDKLDAVERRI